MNRKNKRFLRQARLLSFLAPACCIIRRIFSGESHASVIGLEMEKVKRNSVWIRRQMMICAFAFVVVGGVYPASLSAHRLSPAEAESADNDRVDADVFCEGRDGYTCFRIPAIIVLPNGKLLAFCEGRRYSRGDAGDVDLVMKSSSDGGNTWSELSVVWDDGGNTCGNPAPVWDEAAKKVVLVCTWNNGKDSERMVGEGTSLDTRRVYVLESADEGRSWSVPHEITHEVKPASWQWYATGPCHALQWTKTGRLVVPCNHSENKETRSHLIYSDDHGKTWRLGAVQYERGGNESTVAELKNGNIVQNMRMYYYRDSHPCRASLVSRDGGETYAGAMRFDEALIEPVCQGSLLSLKKKNGKISNKLLFCNPSSTTKRENLQVKVSLDGGLTWKPFATVFAGKAAYSDLVQIDTHTVGVLFECGKKTSDDKIAFVRLKVKP